LQQEDVLRALRRRAKSTGYENVRVRLAEENTTTTTTTSSSSSRSKRVS
jgi:hypothetical protein